jgi:tryptophan-rich sensory protein
VRQSTVFQSRRPSFGEVASLAVAIGLCLLPAVLVAATTGDDVASWYPTLAKPAFTPPSWLFGPVWTVLYGLMGVSLWRIWRTTESRDRTTALVLFAGQLILNAGWSLLFFQFRSPALAAVDIVFLWLLIAVLIRTAARVDRTASRLLAPYLAWVSFAAALNFAILWLN